MFGIGGAALFRLLGLYYSHAMVLHVGDRTTFWYKYYYLIVCWQIAFCGLGLAFFIPALLRRPRDLLQVVITKRMLFRFVWFGYLVLLLFLFEQLSHAILYYKEKIHLKNELDTYEEVHPENVHLWRMKPGYHFRADRIAKEKAASGHYLGATLYELDYRTNAQIAEYVLHVNSLGIRAEELSPKSPDDFRIVCLGDSCTFGAFYADPYPFFIEQRLNVASSKPSRFQVLNCAVEGYAANQVILRYRLDFMNLKPDLVIVYVGWNSLGDPNNNPLNKYPLDADAIIKSFNDCTTPQANLKRKYKTYTGYLLSTLGKHAQSVQVDQSPPNYHRIDPALMPNLPPRLNCLYLNSLVDFLIDEVHLSPRQIVVCTLPGLLNSAQAPSSQTLDLVKFMPDWAEGNTYLYALAYEGYNQYIREMSQQRGLHLIDLEQWSRENLQPEKDFFDPVHFRWYVHPLVGEYIANNLEMFL